MSALFRFVRNAALLAGVIRGLRRGRGREDEIADARAIPARAILEALGAWPIALLWVSVPSLIALSATVRALPLLLIGAAYFGGMDWAPASATSEFFSAAAQVIPVLLLALAVESRFLRFGALVDLRRQPMVAPEFWTVVHASRPGSVGRRLLHVLRAVDTAFGWFRTLQNALTVITLAAGIVFLLALAEWRCLNVLANIGAGSRDPAEVSAGILAGLVGVGVIATIGPGVEAKALARLEDAIWARVIGPLREPLLTALHGSSRDGSA